MLILGLSDMNIERLKKNEPIKFNLGELGFADIEVLIFYGKDEQSMYGMLKDSIDPFRTIIKDERGAKEN